MLKFSLLIAVAAASVSAAMAAEPVLKCDLVAGWTQQGPARSYTADNLFEYMDGNAEGYLIYGFNKMTGISCVKGNVVLAIDVSDMGDTDGAYGMFSANKDPRRDGAKIGMGGQIVPRRCMFAKGQYYLEIAANPEGDYTAVFQEWTAALDKITEGTSSLPPAIGWFPAENQKSFRLVPESVLGLRQLKHGYAAEYPTGKMFLVLEATPESAATVMEKLRTRFRETTATKIADEAFQFVDAYLGRMCIFRKGRYVGGFANVADGQDPVALATAFAAKIQ